MFIQKYVAYVAVGDGGSGFIDPLENDDLWYRLCIESDTDSVTIVFIDLSTYSHETSGGNTTFPTAAISSSSFWVSTPPSQSELSDNISSACVSITSN